MSVGVEKPLVSIITSYYNGIRFLESFLESVQSQTIFSNLELVMDVNEPSESELEILQNFKIRNPNLLRLNIRKKVVPNSVSLNACIQRARAEFICIWNVDDLRTENSIEAQYKMIYNDSSIAVVYGPFEIVNSFGLKNGVLADYRDIPNSQFMRTNLMGPFFMFRKDATKKIGFLDEQFQSSADLDFGIRLMHTGVAKSTTELLGYFLNEGQGISTRGNTVGRFETTAIQLRYGIYGLMNPVYLHQALKFVIPMIKKGEEWIKVSSLIKNFDEVSSSEIDRLKRLYVVDKKFPKLILKQFLFKILKPKV